jgi:hypothetical protein
VPLPTNLLISFPLTASGLSLPHDICGELILLMK